MDKIPFATLAKDDWLLSRKGRTESIKQSGQSCGKYSDLFLYTIGIQLVHYYTSVGQDSLPEKVVRESLFCCIATEATNNTLPLNSNETKKPQKKTI
jgi:hypothetical protein